MRINESEKKMRIALIDVDGHNFPNLPLMKLSAWHKKNGDSVEWYEPLTAWLNPPDMVYMSKVFTFTPDYPHPVCAGEIIKGGTGYKYPVEIHYRKKSNISILITAYILNFAMTQLMDF